jgi:hypothetical protein
VSQPLPITQAAAVSIFVTIVGLIVGLVPNLVAYKAEIISIGGTVIGVAFLLVNEWRAHSTAHVQAARIQANQ